MRKGKPTVSGWNSPPSLRLLHLWPIADRIELARREGGDCLAGDGQPRFSRLPLYPKQRAIIDDPARFTITEATTKAGKTMSHIEWLLEEALAAQSGNWWWVATTRDTADIAYRRMQDRLRGYLDSGGSLRRVADPVPFRKHDTRKIIRIGRATLWFKSAEKPDNLYGEDVYGAVGDEITRWRESAWIALYSTLTATRGRAKLIGNVKGRRNFAYRLARRAESGEAEWGYHRLTAHDAVDGGVLERSIVEQARKDLPPEVYQELYEARAADDSSNPFGLDAVREGIASLSTALPVAWGWDLARSIDWTVGIALDREGKVCRFERWQMPWQETISRIRSRTGTVPALVDSTGVGDPVVDALRRGGGSDHLLPNFRGFNFTATSKQQLMEGLALAIQRGEISFPDGPIVAELESFEFEHTRTGVRYSSPPGMHDDCVCALALALNRRKNWRESRMLI